MLCEGRAVCWLGCANICEHAQAVRASRASASPCYITARFPPPPAHPPTPCLQNKGGEFSALLTSFDWNELDPRRIGTASIDTTCTIWDIERGLVDTQLIAHDKEVGCVFGCVWLGGCVHVWVRGVAWKNGKQGVLQMRAGVAGG